MDNTDYCSYELAVKLKECGFGLECHHYYHGNKICEGCGNNNYNDIRGYPNCFSAPLLWEAQKWLREKKKMHCQVLLNGVRSMYFWQVRELVGNGRYADSTHQYDVYEDAMSDCTSAALELIKKGE